MPLGIVVGLAAEARIAAGLGPIGIGGGMPAGAEAEAEALVANGATALLSFGLAGGLDPNLRAGALVVPVMVLEAGQRYATDETLVRALGGATAGVLLATDSIVARAPDKQRLSQRTQASAVDLESGAVARVAARHGLPFAVLRAICDPAGRDLPPAAVIPLRGGGRIDVPRLLGSLAAQPWQIGGLIRLSLDAAAARRTLVRAARVLLRRLDGGAG